MWLSALSKRTPRAYFIYAIVVLILFNLPQINGYLDFFRDYNSGRLTSSSVLSYTIFLFPIIGFLLSLLVNRVFIIADTFSHNTLWPGYIFTLMVVAIMPEIRFLDLIKHGFLGILMISEILKIQYNRPAGFQCYNIGLLLGLGVLFNSAMLILAPILLYTLINLKPLVFKEYLLYLLGLFTPIYFLLAYCYLVSDFTIWTELLLTVITWFEFSYTLKVGSLIAWMIIAFSLIMVLFITFYNYNSLPVYIRRVSAALMILIGGVFVLGFATQFNGFLIFYIAPAFAFYAAMLMLRYTNKRFVEIIHFIFVLIIVSLHLANKFFL